MNSHRTSKFDNRRPGSSAKVYDYENSNYGPVENSKIPKFPKRTYSLEGRTSCQDQKSFTRPKVSTTSMIPRLERRKNIRTESLVKEKDKIKQNTATAKKEKVLTEHKPNSANKEQPVVKETQDTTAVNLTCPTLQTVPSLECKLNKDFINFKNNVLKIPEYWTDAGKTAASILKNAVNIVKKQYPNMEKESFEAEIESIIKATDAVKQQILTKTEHIISKATQIYAEGTNTNWNASEEDLKKITKKMEELKDEVRIKKYVFGDLLKCSSEVKQLMDLEKILKQKSAGKENVQKEVLDAPQKKTGEEVHQKYSEGKKCKKADNNVVGYKKREKSMLNSCGDILRQESVFLKDKSDKNTEIPQQQKKEKTTQTVISWCSELVSNENKLSELNQEILELQQLCKDHISKFKSFNLQIKLRGICNKAQRISTNKELELLNDEKMQLEEKNSKLLCYNKDLESAIKKKDLDLHQKDKLINQQKKLLHVRDELIEMLKNRCNLEERQHY